jgi:ASC-1-like (ASCH) protein
VSTAPLFQAKKEVYAWLREGRKTIDIRKGKARRGDIAVFQSGAIHLRLPITKKETGTLAEVIRADNYKQIIPPANSVEDALSYLRGLYTAHNGTFTAYYLAKSKN